MSARSRLVTALVAAALGSPPVSGLSQQGAPADQFFTSDGTRIRYIERGSGAPVVLIHGFSVNSEMNWGAVIPRLSPEFRVIALDLRGHGKSEKPQGPDAYGLAMVQDVENLLDHLGVERAHIVGYSMGGAIALKFLTMHPDRVRSAVLGGSGWSRSNQPVGLATLADALEAVADTGGSTSHVILETLGLRDTTVLGAADKAVLDANDPRALAAVARGLDEVDVPAEALSSNAVPTLVLIGERDVFRPLADSLVAVMSNADLEVLPGASHITAPQDPGFARAILAFLEAHAAEGGR